VRFQLGLRYGSRTRRWLEKGKRAERVFKHPPSPDQTEKRRFPDGYSYSRTAAVPRHGVLTNQDVRDLLDAGLPDEVIAAKIKASECSFDTSLEMLKQLKAAGVPAPVILAMVRAGQGGAR